MSLGVCRDEELACILGARELHSIIGILVQVLVACCEGKGRQEQCGYDI